MDVALVNDGPVTVILDSEEPRRSKSSASMSEEAAVKDTL